MKYYINIICILFSLCLSACFSDAPDRVEEPDELTVQAKISEGDLAFVYLTNAIPFNGVIDSLSVIRSIESKAKVTLTDSSGKLEILTLKRDDTQFPFLFYRGNTIIGEFGQEYKLEVELRDKLFTGISKIPKKPIIDNIGFIDSFKNDIIEEESKDVRLTLKNNQEDIAYYKLMIKDNITNEYSPLEPFIINTKNISGDSFSLVLEFEGENEDTEKNENKFIIGDEFTLDVISISKDEYDFLEAVVGSETTLIEGFSFNEQVPTNISGGAFGYWSGESSSKISFVVK